MSIPLVPPGCIFVIFGNNNNVSVVFILSLLPDVLTMSEIVVVLEWLQKYKKMSLVFSWHLYMASSERKLLNLSISVYFWTSLFIFIISYIVTLLSVFMKNGIKKFETRKEEDNLLFFLLRN